TGLRIERGLVQDHRSALAGFQAVDLLAVLHERRDYALGALGLVAKEFGCAELLAQREPDALRRGLAASGPSRARFLALPIHRVSERRLIHADAARLQRVLGEVERKT